MAISADMCHKDVANRCPVRELTAEQRMSANTHRERVRLSKTKEIQHVYSLCLGQSCEAQPA